MADYAFLDAPLACPHCGGPVADRLWFQWGYCPGYAPRPSSLYRVGEPIRWRRMPDGDVPSWSWFRNADGTPAGSNLGDPAVADLVIRDSAQYWLSEPCPRCGDALDGGAVEIRGGAVARGWLLRPGELPPDDHLVRDAAGVLHPVPEWENPRLDLVVLPATDPAES